MTYSDFNHTKQAWKHLQTLCISLHSNQSVHVQPTYMDDIDMRRFVKIAVKKGITFLEFMLTTLCDINIMQYTDG